MLWCLISLMVIMEAWGMLHVQALYGRQRCSRTHIFLSPPVKVARKITAAHCWGCDSNDRVSPSSGSCSILPCVTPGYLVLPITAWESASRGLSYLGTWREQCCKQEPFHLAPILEAFWRKVEEFLPPCAHRILSVYPCLEDLKGSLFVNPTREFPSN